MGDQKLSKTEEAIQNARKALENIRKLEDAYYHSIKHKKAPEECDLRLCTVIAFSPGAEPVIRFHEDGLHSAYRLNHYEKENIEIPGQEPITRETRFLCQEHYGALSELRMNILGLLNPAFKVTQRFKLESSLHQIFVTAIQPDESGSMGFKQFLRLKLGGEFIVSEERHLNLFKNITQK